MELRSVFQKLKPIKILRANDPLIQVLEGSEIEEAILSAFASVTVMDGSKIVDIIHTHRLNSITMFMYYVYLMLVINY